MLQSAITQRALLPLTYNVQTSTTSESVLIVTDGRESPPLLILMVGVLSCQKSKLGDLWSLIHAKLIEWVTLEE